MRKFTFLLFALLLWAGTASAQFTTTTNYGLKKPNSGLVSRWDTYLNSDLDSIDSLLAAASSSAGLISCLNVTPACVPDNSVLDASTTNTSNIVTCPNSDCNFTTTAAVGNVFQCGTATQGIVLTTTTIQSVDSATQVHTVANATGTSVGAAYCAWGVDNTASMDALSNASTKVCKYGFLPAGQYLTSHPDFIVANANCANQNAGRVGGLIGAGPGWLNSKLLLMYTLNYANCTGGTTGHICFFGILALDIRAIAIDGMYNNTNPSVSTYIDENNAGYFDRVGTSGAAGTLAPTNLSMTHFAGTEAISREGASVGGANACVNDGTGTQLIIHPCLQGNFSGIFGNTGSFHSKGNFYGATTHAMYCAAGATCHHENDSVQLGDMTNLGAVYYDKLFSVGNVVNTSGTMSIRNTTVGGTLSNALGAVVFDAGQNAFSGVVTNNGVWTGDNSVNGILQVAGNITASTGWGTSGAAGNGISAVTGQTINEQFTITAAGTPTASPTVAIVFPRAFQVAPTLCFAIQTGGTGAIQPLTVSTPQTVSGVTFKWIGTPVAASTYIISVECSNK